MRKRFVSSLAAVTFADVGLFGFSLASVNAVANLFQDRAEHPSVLYWIGALCIEFFTAWMIRQAVEQLYFITRSRTTKQDRRFGRIVIIAYIVFALPTLVVSVTANRAEFSGDFWLGATFPALAIGSAIGGKLPAVVAQYRKAEEGKRKSSEADRLSAAAIRETAAALGHLQDAYAYICGNPGATTGDVAAGIGKSTRTARIHVAQLVDRRLVKRNGTGIHASGR